MVDWLIAGLIVNFPRILCQRVLVIGANHRVHHRGRDVPARLHRIYQGCTIHPANLAPRRFVNFPFWGETNVLNLNLISFSDICFTSKRVIKSNVSPNVSPKCLNQLISFALTVDAPTLDRSGGELSWRQELQWVHPGAKPHPTLRASPYGKRTRGHDATWRHLFGVPPEGHQRDLAIPTRMRRS